MGIGEVRVDLYGFVVVRPSSVHVAGVFQRQSEVVVQNRIVGSALQRLTIATNRFVKVAGIVQETAQIDVGVAHLRIDVDGMSIRGSGGLGIVETLDRERLATRHEDTRFMDAVIGVLRDPGLALDPSFRRYCAGCQDLLTPRQAAERWCCWRAA